MDMKCWIKHCNADADVLLLHPRGVFASFIPRCAKHFDSPDNELLFFFKDQVTAYLVAERLSDGP